MCGYTRRSRVSRSMAGDMRKTKCSLTTTNAGTSSVQGGATIFVCGNARTLAPGVRAALQQIGHAAKSSSTSDEAASWLAGLRREHRYLEDIWGSN